MHVGEPLDADVDLLGRVPAAGDVEFLALGGAAADEDEADDSDGEVTPASSGKKAKVVVEEEELPSVEAKQKDRDALARAMEEFLARGGKVQEVEPNVVADPPKKPDSKYGSRPI